MRFWLEAVFGMPYGARDKVRQMGQRAGWDCDRALHAFFDAGETERRKGGSGPPHAEAAAGEVG